MKVGILSDTHDNIRNVATAFDGLHKAGVEYIIHAGDYVAPFCLRALFKLKESLPFIGVYGNCDGDRENLQEVAQDTLYPSPHIFELCGKRIFLTHSLQREDIETISREYDVIICGHTHENEIRKLNKALIINPGECCGVIRGIASYVILDLDTMKATVTMFDQG